jgi:hypothetical protein
MRIRLDIRFALTCILPFVGTGTANAQCYTFSSGSAASLTLNLPNLPTPTGSTAGGLNYGLTTENTAGDSATLTIGQTDERKSAVYPVRRFEFRWWEER